jgi:tetratricopeptide (TPR) repeat protein
MMTQLSDLPRHFVLVFALITSLSPLRAGDFETGIDAYHTSNYTEAAEAFESALAAEPGAAAHHNLALSYFQMGEPAKAVWQLEHAVRLDPLNESYLFKLGLLRQQLSLNAAPAEWWQSAARLLPPNRWIWIVSISAWLLIAAIILPRIVRKRRPAALKLSIGIATGALLLSAAALAILTTQQADGVVLSKEAATLHHAPASAAPAAGLARPGERARRLDAHGDFLKIETEARITGWIQKEAFGEL